MANLFDYITWRGDLTFEQVPFSKLDALLLSHLSYSIFDGLLTDSFDDKKTLKQLAADFKNSPDYEQRINIGFLINKQTAKLMFACAESPRFKDVQICGYKLIYNEENCEQFAAMVYLAGGKTIISYRGTDDTITGWREDFNIAWMDQIPAQKDALEYMDKAAKYFTGNFIVVGHSKGGNLVINTAVKTDKAIRDRLEVLYNFDGPGFPKEFYDQKEYKEIEPRLQSVYPEFSVVGMIFHHPKKYQIAKSDGFAVMQHDAMTWQVLGPDYDKAEDFKDESKYFAKNFNKWIDSLTPADKKRFVNALFDVIEASGAKTLNELEDNAVVSARRIIQKLASLDKETKKEVHKILNLLVDIVKKDSPLALLLKVPKLSDLTPEKQKNL